MTTPKHAASFSVRRRHPDKVWQALCGRHAAFTGPTYEAVEDQWRQHVYDTTGKAPRALGDTAIARWDVGSTTHECGGPS